MAIRHPEQPPVSQDGGLLFVHFSTNATEVDVLMALQKTAAVGLEKPSAVAFSEVLGCSLPLLVTLELSVSPYTKGMSASARTQRLLRSLRLCLQPFRIGEMQVAWQLPLPGDLDPLDGAPS